MVRACRDAPRRQAGRRTVFHWPHVELKPTAKAEGDRRAAGPHADLGAAQLVHWRTSTTQAAIALADDENHDDRNDHAATCSDTLPRL